MIRRPAALLLSLALVAGCAGAAPPSATPGDVAPSGAPGSPPPWSAPPDAGSPAVIDTDWVRLDWTEVDLPGIPRYRWRTSVMQSELGTLLRYIERPGPSPAETTVTVLATRDGVRWTHATTSAGDSPLGMPIDGAGVWLQAVPPEDGTSPIELLASSDGRTWTHRGALPAELGSVFASAVHDSAIVACGMTREVGAGTVRCAASPDSGATWTHLGALLPLLDRGGFTGVSATPAGFMIVGDRVAGRDVVAVAATSPDGTTWTDLPESPLEGMSTEIAGRLASIGDAFVLSATSLDGGEYIRALWTTVDGRSWRRVPLPRVVAWSGGFEVLGSALVAMASEGRGDEMRYVGAFVSGDGLTWRADTLPTVLTGTYDWEWYMMPAGGGLLAFEQGTGSASVTPRAFLGRPVAAGDPGPSPAPATTTTVPAGTAPPAVTWTVGPSTAGTRVADVVRWNGGYLAVGYAADADGQAEGPAAWASADGLTWTRTLDPASAPGARMLHVVASGSTLVAAGDTIVAAPDAPSAAADAPGTGSVVLARATLAGDAETSRPVAAFWRSLDGRAWERVPSRADFTIGRPPLEDAWITGLFDLVVGGPGFVAVGATRSGGATVWTTADGLHWARTATLGQAVMSSVTATGTGLVAFGETGGPNSIDKTWASADGLAWRAVERSTVDTAVTAPVPGSAVLQAGLPPAWSTDGLVWRSAPAQPAFERHLNEEGMATVVALPNGYVGAGTGVCPDVLRPCAAVWASADFGRWDVAMLPTAEPANPTSPNAPIAPVAAVADGGRVVVVGSTFTFGGPFDAATGWASWVGVVATP